MQIHTTNAPRVVASIAATGLVVASTGFGAVYAYQVGVHGGSALAGLTITFAVALELAKPLAISSAFEALGEYHFGRGLSLSLLGLVAVAYSLTSELALVSMSRGDLAAERASAAFQAKANQERYQRAQQELASLKPTKPVAELEALVAKTSKRDCAWLNGTMKKVCSPSPYAAELGRAKRRQELEAILATTGQTSGHTVASADPGSTALTTYLSALGMQASAENVATWLNLVPVLALELGSAFAALLAGGFTPRTVAEPQQKEAQTKTTTVGDRILSHLKNHPGPRVSERGLAKVLGLDRNKVRRTIHSLAACGLLAAEATKAGTNLRLL